MNNVRKATIATAILLAGGLGQAAQAEVKVGLMLPATAPTRRLARRLKMALNCTSRNRAANWAVNRSSILLWMTNLIRPRHQRIPTGWCSATRSMYW